MDAETPLKITILMPCYNGLKHIAQAIESVRAQSMINWELLVSDDGSTDGTREFLNDIRDDRIEVFFQKQNLGIFGNLNYLFSRARGPITQILCQDDRFINEDALLLISEIWNSLPGEVAFLRCNHGSESGSALVALEQDILPEVVEPKESDLFFFIFGCIPGNLSNVSVRTRVVEEVGGYRTDLPYAGDFEFWSRVGRHKPWAISKSKVAFVREHSDQASATLNKKGELLSQLSCIIRVLFENLQENQIRTPLLRLMATSTYAIQHFDRGIRAGVLGNGWEYFTEVRRHFLKSPYFLGGFVTGLFYCFSIRGKFYGPTIARYLIDRHRTRVTRV